MAKAQRLTDEEARQLKVGDLVLCRIGKSTATCEITRTAEHIKQDWRGTDYWQVRLRKVGTSMSGARFPDQAKSAYQLFHYHGKQDIVRANVFADFLEEKGFSEAATALRQAFPLIPLEE